MILNTVTTNNNIVLHALSVLARNKKKKEEKRTSSYRDHKWQVKYVLHQQRLPIITVSFINQKNIIV